MKKTLIALAAVAATGAAFAQSSVTLYGVADLSLAKATGSSAQLSGNGTMNNGSSRLGVRGVEDLGGGLKAAFNFEQAINAETGATDVAVTRDPVTGAVTNVTNTTFQRAANISLMGGFGTVKLGRTLTPSFHGVAAWELTGTANYSVVASQFSFAGAGARNNSEISYTTPSMGGLTATLGTVLKADNAGNAKYDLNVIYRTGPVAAALSYNKVDNAVRNVALGAAYNFGAFKVAGSFQDPAGNGKGFTVGGSTNVGPVALTLDIARDTHFKDTNVLVEGKYALSKRTTAYAALLRDGKGKTATSANNFGLGVRHNF
ncbi:MAG: porin [Hydrogenophaga sp.]|nr:porin [Hydrogenophaga sp.]